MLLTNKLVQCLKKCRMGTVCLITIMMLPIVAFFALLSTVESRNDFEYCNNTVRGWAYSGSGNDFGENKLTLRDLMFFLHIPRTGGRSYFHCFLKKVYTDSLECPRSYDKLHFDPSKPNCRLMATHDDYSIMSKLPKEHTSILTIMRNPVDRVLSMYEFAVEVAARFLIHPNLTTAIQTSIRIRSKIRGTSTLDIWPWKYLVPWMREDLFARRDGWKFGSTAQSGYRNDPYDMEEVVMPLRSFLNDPLAHDIVHNGATFQVAGLTNNSYLPESQEIRRCIREHPKLGNYVLNIAKKRLSNMLYVGLTEDHKASASLLMNVVGSQMSSMLDNFRYSGNESRSLYELLQPVLASLPNNSTPRGQEGKFSSSSPLLLGNLTGSKLMEEYETCISNLRGIQNKRRASSLKRISPANFSKEARLKLSETVLEHIRSLNKLDLELYEHARQIFAEHQRHVKEKNLLPVSCIFPEF